MSDIVFPRSAFLRRISTMYGIGSVGRVTKGATDLARAAPRTTYDNGDRDHPIPGAMRWHCHCNGLRYQAAAVNPRHATTAACQQAAASALKARRVDRDTR